MEVRNNKRSYFMSDLDIMVGKGSCRGYWVEWIKVWQQESYVLVFRGQGIEINQFGWNIYVVL